MDARPKTTPGRLRWVWDYDLDEEQFARLLRGELTLGRLDRDWAALRLIEYAPCEEIVRRPFGWASCSSRSSGAGALLRRATDQLPTAS